MPKTMDPTLPILFMLGYWGAILGTLEVQVVPKHKGLSWLAVKELKLSCHNPEAISSTIHPCYGNFQQQPSKGNECDLEV